MIPQVTTILTRPGMKTMAKTCKLVAYYRVSTDKQGKSGLGLEAQQALVASYATQTGCTIMVSYTEVESGKRSDRPEMDKAVAHAKRAKATLVIATLSRLARKVHFISGLMESGVDFVAADSPNDDRFMIHVKSAVDEDEARKIGQRTKAALAALKARGVVLGTPANLTNDAREKGSKVNHDQAVREYASIVPTMLAHKAAGMSLAKIATALNTDGITTRTGSTWTSMQIKRVLDRG